MVSTKVPFGAISDDYVNCLLPVLQDGKCYILDNFGSRIEVEPEVYNKLSMKGVRIYEGSIEKSGIKQL